MLVPSVSLRPDIFSPFPAANQRISRNSGAPAPRTSGIAFGLPVLLQSKNNSRPYFHPEVSLSILNKFLFSRSGNRVRSFRQFPDPRPIEAPAILKNPKYLWCILGWNVRGRYTQFVK